MRCWNCNRELPDSAKVCVSCEAPVEEEPTEEEKQAVLDILNRMPPGFVSDLRRAAAECNTAEEFANSIFVGGCPKCASSRTGDCDNDPEIDCILVGRCYDCGQLWCTECGELLEAKSPRCDCWDEEDEFDDGLDDE